MPSIGQSSKSLKSWIPPCEATSDNVIQGHSLGFGNCRAVREAGGVNMEGVVGGGVSRKALGGLLEDVSKRPKVLDAYCI